MRCFVVNLSCSRCPYRMTFSFLTAFSGFAKMNVVIAYDVRSLFTFWYIAVHFSVGCVHWFWYSLSFVNIMTCRSDGVWRRPRMGWFTSRDTGLRFSASRLDMTGLKTSPFRGRGWSGCWMQISGLGRGCVPERWLNRWTPNESYSCQVYWVCVDFFIWATTFYHFDGSVVVGEESAWFVYNVVLQWC